MASFDPISDNLMTAIQQRNVTEVCALLDQSMSNLLAVFLMPFFTKNMRSLNFYSR